MNLQELRIAHSTLLEHYQFIEMHLEGIYAVLSGKSFFSGLEDVERRSIYKIIKMIRRIEHIQGVSIFSEQIYSELESLNRSRNFWVHNCYTDLVFNHRSETLKKPEDVKRLHNDIRTAVQMRDFLYNKYMELLESLRM